jgi:hypothetical protein
VLVGANRGVASWVAADIGVGDVSGAAMNQAQFDFWTVGLPERRVHTKARRRGHGVLFEGCYKGSITVSKGIFSCLTEPSVP